MALPGANTHNDASGFSYRYDFLDSIELFTSRRSHKYFDGRPVTETSLRKLYELAKLAPSASNCCPMRLVFATSGGARQQLLDAVISRNADQVRSAPVTAIIAFDTNFHEHMEKLAPDSDYAARFRSFSHEKRAEVALRNCSVQAGFLIMAAHALGLQCGPISGFDAAKINSTFFPDSTWRVNFLLNIGYGTDEGLKPRANRLDFDTACKLA